MDGNVLVTISGKRMMGFDSENVEYVIPGTCERLGELYRVRYRETADEEGGVIDNTLLIGKAGMQISRQGLANVEMVFRNSAARQTSCYSTPFGDLMVGISTQDYALSESDDRVHVMVDYAMDIGDMHVSDCSISVDVSARPS